MSFNIYTTSLSNIDGMKKKLIFFKKKLQLEKDTNILENF